MIEKDGIKEKMLEQLKEVYTQYFYTASGTDPNALYLNFSEGVCIGARMMAEIAGIPDEEIESIIEQSKELALDERARMKRELEELLK